MALTQIRQTIINEQYSGVVPIGGIIMFSGNIASLPSGWSFCNGSNGTPDLRDKFIIGAYADSSGQANTTVTGSTTKNGGSKDISGSSNNTALTISQIPSHSHSVSGVSVAGDYIQIYPGYGSGTFGDSTTGAAGSGQGHNHSLSITNANLPPYYALAFIMRIS